MALQWMILAYVVAAEAAIAVILTLPAPKAIQSRISSLISRIVQPSLFIVPFSAFQLLDIYWKSEHRLKCSGETCTAAERSRYERAVCSLWSVDLELKKYLFVQKSISDRMPDSIDRIK
ncbi:uncharacterized protein LOC121748503 isoform X2 [Salvia splendens]|uniref:uncharacterized protein LOC121748503 isoform X2 n=1 Tax=Salvia splendens TaxID=180675 RepID=UPI001C2567DF|nr:uncharacterized protein LOC121748503 isoform X2 [Salvia splendens]